ncbi:MAG: phosphatase family protein [Ferruginibacter sp.]|nr:phosphatase family protein [Ferruginibacter sp.]
MKFFRSPGQIVALLLLIFAVIVFGLLAHEVVNENEDWFDSKVFTFFKSYSLPWIVNFFRYISFFGSDYFLLPAYAIVVVTVFFKSQKTAAFDIALLAITSTLLLFGLKTAFGRVRPPFPLLITLKNYSFPSGHAVSSFIFFSIIAWLVWKTGISQKCKWLVSFFSFWLVIMVGVSRIVLRYHYASDVVAGFSLGMVCMILFLFAQNLREHNQ